MTPAGEIRDWTIAQTPPIYDADAIAIHAHRRPPDFGPRDAVVVVLESSRDGHLFGGAGLGHRLGGESMLQIGLWHIPNKQRDAIHRDPETSLQALQGIYDEIVQVRRQVIGSMNVRHIERGLGPLQRWDDAAAEVAGYARVIMQVEGC